MQINFHNLEAKEYFEQLGEMSGRDFYREFRSKYEIYCEKIINYEKINLKRKNRSLSGIFKITPGRIKNSQGVTYGLLRKEIYDEESGI